MKPGLLEGNTESEQMVKMSSQGRGLVAGTVMVAKTEGKETNFAYTLVAETRLVDLLGSGRTKKT